MPWGSNEAAQGVRTRGTRMPGGAPPSSDSILGDKPAGDEPMNARSHLNIAAARVRRTPQAPAQGRRAPAF